MSILSPEVCKSLLEKLEDTARYAEILLALAEGFGQGFFLALWAKKRALYAVLAHFRPFFGVQ